MSKYSKPNDVNSALNKCEDYKGKNGKYAGKFEKIRFN